MLDAASRVKPSDCGSAPIDCPGKMPVVGDIEAILVTIFVGSVVVGLIIVLLLLLLPLAPRPMQDRVRQALLRWSQSGPELLSQTSYWYAILLVASVFLAAAIAIASLVLR